jgi:hypothetical protein
MKSSISHLIRSLTSQTNRSLILVLIILSLSNVSYAQQYAASQTNDDNDSGLATASVTNPDNVTGAADNAFARLSASGLVVSFLLTVSSDASITMTLPQSVAAGKYSYVKIATPTVQGLSLDLGDLVNVLGLLENETIEVTTNAGTAQSTLVKDGANNLYLQVTSSAAYTSITVTLDFDNSVGLLGVGLGRINLDIDNVVTYANGTAYTACESVLRFTNIDDPDASGITVNITDAIQNPQQAIDGNMATASLLTNGQVNVVTDVSQTVYLEKTVPGTNEVVATISKPVGLVDIDVLDGIFIQAYLGNVAVGTPRIISSSLLSLGLLSGFNATPVTITFAPGGPYDRITITSGGVANVFTGLAIHELSSRSPITFTGGRVVGSIAGEPVNSSILVATANVSSPVLAGFNIGCSTPAEHTYSLYEVDQSARTLSGSLPPSFTLSPTGQLTGNPELDENDTYTFDILATNQFGQRAFTTFVVTIETNLPVTLVKFDAVAEGRTTSLTWSTSAETNSDRFEIERSLTGKNWSKIGTVSSNHESTSLQYYSFVDSKPSDGQNLYRLKMIDLDETFSYSQIKNVNFAISDYLYPNPVSSNENLSINLNDWSKIKLVKVINATGKTVFESSNALSSGINTKNLSAGTYVLKMIHTNGSVSTHKFVRQ